MIEFMKSIYEWFSSNQTGITTTLCSSSTIMLIASIVLGIKQRNIVSNNTITVSELTKGINTNNAVQSSIDNIADESKKSLEVAETCNSNVKDVKQELYNFKSEIEEKLNLMLEVQGIVYSTLKNDTMRESVTALITKAKHVEDKTDESLEKELQELQDKFDEIVTAASTTVTEAVDKVKASAGITHSETLTRY